MTLEDIMREQARLIILKALADQVDETLNSDLLAHEMEAFGIRKPREWLHDQLAWLTSMEAVRTERVGTLLVATLTEKGAQHLRREIAIEGIKRPSRPGG